MRGWAGRVDAMHRGVEAVLGVQASATTTVTPCRYQSLNSALPAAGHKQQQQQQHHKQHERQLPAGSTEAGGGVEVPPCVLPFLPSLAHPSGAAESLSRLVHDLPAGGALRCGAAWLPG